VASRAKGQSSPSAKTSAKHLVSEPVRHNDGIEGVRYALHVISIAHFQFIARVRMSIRIVPPVAYLVLLSSPINTIAKISPRSLSVPLPTTGWPQPGQKFKGEQ
jgi:hypothetical protein